MSYCANCGAELNPSEKFCHNCGHENEPDPTSKAAPPESASAPAAVASPPKAKGGIKKILITIGITAIGMIALIIALAFLLTSGLPKSAEAHFAALKTGNIEQAYNETAGLFRQSTSLEDYRRFIDAYPILKDVADTHFAERSVENNEGLLKGEVSDSQGNRVPITIEFIKEQDEWRILGIDLPQAGPSVTPTTPPAAPPASTPGGAPPAAPAATQPPTQGGAPAIGKILVGAGRNQNGALISPDQPVPANAPKLSADIELINYPQGMRVQIWVEHYGSDKKTQPVDATVEGAGSGTITYELDAPPGGVWPTGRWRILVLLGEEKQFSTDFEIL